MPVRLVSSREIQIAVGLLAARGVSRPDALAAAGVSEIDLASSALLPMSRLTNTWLFVRRNFDAAFAVENGENHEFRDYGATGALFKSSANVRAAVTDAVDFIRLHADIDWHFVEGDSYWMIVLLTPHHSNLDAQVYADISGVVEWLNVLRRYLLLPDLQPIEVRFPHAPPRGACEIGRVISAPIRWKIGPLAIVFPKALLGVPNPSPNQRQFNAVRASVSAALDLRKRWTHRVVRALDERFRLSEGSEPDLRRLISLPSIAATCRPVSGPRTLERRLKEEGATFGQLRDDVRRDVAMVQLADDGVSQDLAASRVGFTDAAALNRAFRRWTRGWTERPPSDYRLTRPSAVA